MTLDEKRIKVAEKCGWKKDIIKTTRYNSIDDKEYDVIVYRNPEGSIIGHGDVPDYPNDLNAMHEAEKVLSIKECVKYENHLLKAANKNYCDDKLDIPSQHLRWGVKCEQRFDAFGITCGLWKEGE